MDSPNWLRADYWYHVHDIIKAGELNMQYMTPINAYLYYFERCNPVRRILNNHVSQ